MNKYVLIAVALLGLSGCESEPTRNIGADGYKFGEPQYVKEAVEIEVIIYDDERALRDSMPGKWSQARRKTVVAYSQLYPQKDYNYCKIHIVDPRVKYEPEFIGHEFFHCIYGQWHTNNEARE